MRIKRYTTLIAIGLVLIICFAALYHFASESPDPVESVIHESGKVAKKSYSFFYGYELPFIQSKFLMGTFIIILGGGLSAALIYFLLKKMAGSK